MPGAVGGDEFAQGCRGVAAVECGHDGGEPRFARAFPVGSVGRGGIGVGGEGGDAVGEGVGAGVGGGQAAVFTFACGVAGQVVVWFVGW